MSLGTMERFCLGTAVLVLAALGCSESSSNDDETGGTENAGGAASGGAANGGTDNSGGTAGGQNNGGSTESTGGEAGSAATSETVLFGFDEGLEDFLLDAYYSADFPNLADMDEADGEQPAEGLLLEWTEDAGSDENSGVLKVTAPFSGWDQSVNVQANYTDQPDMTGRTLRARVKIENDGGYVNTDGAAGGAFIYVKTGEGDDWIFGRGEWTSLEADDYGTWVELEFELEDPGDSSDGYDFTLVRSIGIQVGTGSYTGDETTLPTTATVWIDQITIE